MPAKIRKLKNKKRGTELTYAVIPIDKVRNLRDHDNFFRKNPNYDESLKEDIIGQLQQFYGTNVNYDNALKKLTEVAYKESIEEREEYQQRTGQKIPKPPKEDLIVLKDKDDRSKEHYLSVKRIGKRLLITPAPVIHNIMGHREKAKVGMSSGEIEKFDAKKDAGKSSYLPQYSLREEEGTTQFDDLVSILKGGFKSHDYEEENALVKINKKHRINYKSPGGVGFELKNEGITKGDVFGIEIFPKKGFAKGERFNRRNFEKYAYRVTEASPENISSINIQLAEGASEDEREEKMKFYEEQLSSFDIPYRFFTVREDENEQPVYQRVFPKQRNLEKRLLGIISIGGFVAGIFFLSPLVTGNVINDFNPQVTNGIGVGLIGIALIGIYISIRSKFNK